MSSSMGIELVSLADHGLDRAAEVFNRGFSDYLVRISATPATLLQMARTDSVDLTLSRVVVRDGVPVGAALIARRGWTSRLAGMALVPEARRQGVGREVMTRLLDEARVRSDRSMVLEVIEQNAPAVALYEACGFTKVRRLVGFSRPAEGEPSTEGAGPALEEVDLRSLGAAVTRHGWPDLPWQLSGESLAHLTPPSIGYHQAGAWTAVTGLTGTQGVFRGLVTERSLQGKGRGAALLRSVMQRHPGREWKVTAIWPEELGAVFEEAGFARAPLSQWQMARPVASPGTVG